MGGHICKLLCLQTNISISGLIWCRLFTVVNSICARSNNSPLISVCSPPGYIKQALFLTNISPTRSTIFSVVCTLIYMLDHSNITLVAQLMTVKSLEFIFLCLFDRTGCTTLMPLHSFRRPPMGKAPVASALAVLPRCRHRLLLATASEVPTRHPPSTGN